MKKYLLILIISLIGISAAHAQISCPVISHHNNKQVTLVHASIVSNGHNNYLNCVYDTGSGSIRDELIPAHKNIYHAVNPQLWEKHGSNLLHVCSAFRNLKRPYNESQIKEISQQCAVRECSIKGPCIS